MFTEAIEEISKFLRPLHSICRYYKETGIYSFANTLFFINENGVAITCRHVAEKIEKRAESFDSYDKFQKERDRIGKNISGQRLRELELKYNLNKGKETRTLVQCKEKILNMPFEFSGKFRFVHHPEYDLSIILLENFKTGSHRSYARFLKDSSSLKIGQSLCFMGFPVSDFSNYRYNSKTDDIEWTNTGKLQSYPFPIQGMLTRFGGKGNTTDSFLIGAASFPGHSGSPVFNPAGLICGMNTGTVMFRDGKFINSEEAMKISVPKGFDASPQMHLSMAVHVDIIKDFLKRNKIKYYEG